MLKEKLREKEKVEEEEMKVEVAAGMTEDEAEKERNGRKGEERFLQLKYKYTNPPTLTLKLSRRP